MLASLACALGGGLPLLGGPRRPQKTARARIIPQVRDEVKRRGRKLCPIAARRPALNDLIPGRVDCYFGSGALLENMRSGQVRGLAVTGAKRDPAAPELPTMAE